MIKHLFSHRFRYKIIVIDGQFMNFLKMLGQDAIILERHFTIVTGEVPRCLMILEIFVLIEHLGGCRLSRQTPPFAPDLWPLDPEAVEADMGGEVEQHVHLQPGATKPLNQCFRN